MRLINADKGLISKIQRETGCNFITAQKIVDSMPTEKAIPIPDNATNGDMLTALFGEKALITIDTHNYLKKWWDAPYKRGSEE